MPSFKGDVVRDDECFEEYENARSWTSRSLTIWPRSWNEETLVAFDADRILVTSGFVPVDVGRERMLLNQSYSKIERIMPQRFSIKGKRFTLEADPVTVLGRSVVIGGLLDANWYHWLFSWAPRLLLLRMLRPDAFHGEHVRIAVHGIALEQPFRAVLDSFGLAPARYLALDPAHDYLFEQAVLVSFCDQNKLSPALIRAMSYHLLKAFGIGPGLPARRRVFASRQVMPPSRRRIANFAEVEPVLAGEFGFEVVSLGERHARDQARLFFDAAIVVGAHGSDLANLMFCRPGTQVLVIENQYSLDQDLHAGLLYLCEVLELHYEVLVSASEPYTGPAEGARFGQINADYVVDPSQLRQRLTQVVART